METMKIQTLIVGGGIAGLVLAHRLHEAGQNVVVLDKGRGVGGRMTTRRMGGGRADHGAQFFTVRDPAFAREVDRWVAAGVATLWWESSEGHHPRYRGVNGMSDIAKWLARDLTVHTGEQVTALARRDGHWLVRTASGATWQAQRLVLTAPLPQSLALLAPVGLILPPGLATVTYDRCVALLALLDGPANLPAPGGLALQTPPLSWAADNQAKGISDQPTLTLHADPTFSDLHWESPDTVRGPLMLAAAAELLKGRQVLEYVCHRWGFAQARATWHEPCYQDASAQLLLAGDAFGGGRVEGAVLSGLAGAARLLGR